MRSGLRRLAFALGVCALAACKGGAGKQEIPLIGSQTYLLQSSGKMKVYPAASTDGAGSQPLQKLQVKRKNDGEAAKTPGCWACTDCICNGAECACTECTSC